MEPIPGVPRRDGSAGDARTMGLPGVVELQPVPAPSIQPFLEPDLPPPPDDEAD